MRSGISLLLLFACAVPLSLPQSSGGHILNGYVREEGTETAIQGASLEITYSGTRAAQPATSGTTGEFKFSGLRDGDFYMVVSKNGYDTANVQVTIPAGEPARP